MSDSVKLSALPRRPSPLSVPPDYFDRLPARVMARLPAARPAAPGWLAALAPAWRTALASTVVLGGFGVAFWLGGAVPSAVPLSAGARLDALPRTALTHYLLSDEVRLDNADLLPLLRAHPELAQRFLHVSAGELREAIEAQPSEDLYF